MIRVSAALAALAVSQLVSVWPLAAQPYESDMRGAQMVDHMPPYETLAIVRSIGLRPITQPMREGPTYVLRAIDRRGEERRVVIDAHYGDVLSAVPVVRMRGYPDARVARLRDRDFDDESEMTQPSPYPPRVIPAPRSSPAPRAAAVAPTQRSAQPPVPRPRPNNSQSAAAPPAPVAPPASKPVETKPAETKPIEAKPADKPPAETPFVPDVAPLD